MFTSIKKVAMASALLATATVSTSAMAELTGNFGFTSNYIVRGINFGESGAYGGIDYSSDMFYAGIWVIDDGANGVDGLETDFYVGVAGESGDFSWDVALIRYEYTYTTTAETEIAASFGFSDWFGLTIAQGNDDDGTVDSDYTYFEVSFSGEVAGGNVTFKYGDTDLDEDDLFANGAGFFFPDTTYLELGFSGEVAGFDWAVGVGEQIDEPAGVGDIDAYMFIDISKTFDL